MDPHELREIKDTVGKSLIGVPGVAESSTQHWIGDDDQMLIETTSYIKPEMDNNKTHTGLKNTESKLINQFPHVTFEFHRSTEDGPMIKQFRKLVKQTLAQSHS